MSGDCIEGWKMSGDCIEGGVDDWILYRGMGRCLKTV